MSRCRTVILGCALAVCALAQSARAARPIVDYHKLDAYFSLFAADSSVPWTPATVRVDTFSGAPIEFSVYAVNPADVLVAGANTGARAIDTRGRRPLATWRFSPPGGFRFQGNDVAVPLGSREGFFVVQARRAGVAEQVWIDRTRVGLVAKTASREIDVYGTDLGTGMPLRHMRVSFVVNGRFADRYTDSHGVVRWRGRGRPVFALAQWGSSVAFVSFLPQPPFPKAILGVRTESAVAHAGGVVRVIGFERVRSALALRPGAGTVSVSLRSAARTVAIVASHLDEAGAFSATLRVPREAPAGAYTVLAAAAGAIAASPVHVDANAGGLSLTIASACERVRCDPSLDVPVRVTALRDGIPAPGVRVRVSVVRSPHAYTGAQPAQPWGIAQWLETDVTTAAGGHAFVAIPHPTDGLPSTYGIRASSAGATADSRIVVTAAPFTVRIVPDRSDIGNGSSAAFQVFGTDLATGQPLTKSEVRVQLVHGAAIAQQTLWLDAAGEARGAFSDPSVGSDLLIATLSARGAEATDAAEVDVEPQTMEMNGERSGSIALNLNADRYASGQTVRVRAALPGARGDAILSLESADEIQLREVPVRDGACTASFVAADTRGQVAVGAAFVREGAIDWTTEPVAIDAPGRPISPPVALDKPTYRPGSVAKAQFLGLRPGAGTVVVRITRGMPSGSAAFDDAADVLSAESAATAVSAIAGTSWHPWVDASGARAPVQSFARRTAPPPTLRMTEADTQSLSWKVVRAAGSAIDVTVPDAAGTYVISLLKIADDGRVSAGSTNVVVAP